MKSEIDRNIETSYSNCSLFYSERAYQAYRNEKPEIATWAVEGKIQEFNKLLNEDLNSKVIYDKDTLHFDLMLSHARLAKLYGETGKDKQEKHNQEKAIFFAKLAIPSGEVNNISKVMKIVDRIDRNITNQEGENNLSSH